MLTLYSSVLCKNSWQTFKEKETPNKISVMLNIRKQNTKKKKPTGISEVRYSKTYGHSEILIPTPYREYEILVIIAKTGEFLTN